MTEDEIRKYVATIDESKKAIEGHKKKIGFAYGRLAGVAARAYADAPKTCGAETRKMRIYFRLPCASSPIGVCVYNEDCVSLPYLRGETTTSGGCLFCGVFHGSATLDWPPNRQRRSSFLGA